MRVGIIYPGVVNRGLICFGTVRDYADIPRGSMLFFCPFLKKNCKYLIEKDGDFYIFTTIQKMHP